MAKHFLTKDQIKRLRESDWLSDRQKKIIELHFMKGMYVEDVAAELYISRSTAEREIDRIMNHVRWFEDG